ncbi:hypothetical protein GCM10010946_23350 [Undibacterium squillarum]|uniref:Uncharacterized protein n=1 Tax=Undibacterium squillarum TaxID=1131567 RepID=A0ABQ2XYT5_9BURK|nr:hypothetical protein GCM10010946_23350 [Undibacterium squillarum]
MYTHPVTNVTPAYLTSLASQADQMLTIHKKNNVFTIETLKISAEKQKLQKTENEVKFEGT